jgi:outer membrane protein assembly factor BamB
VPGREFALVQEADNTMTCKTAVTVSFLWVLCAPAYPGDWPQWRGPGRDGVWSEDPVVGQFPGAGLPIRWRAEVGPGYSGPTVAAGRVFVMDRQTSPREIERVLCLDAATGKTIWRHEYACPYEKVQYTAGPRASVTVDQDLAFSLGTMGHLLCLKVTDGQVVWGKDLRAEYQVAMPIWGIASSPLVEGDLVIVQAGGRPGACLIAFDKRSGKERWRALDDRASYSSPIVVDQADKRVLVCWTGDRVVGLDPHTGGVFWQVPFKPRQMVINTATPVFQSHHLFLSGFYDGSLLLRLDPNELKVEKVWQRCGQSEQVTEALHCLISTPLIQGDFIYGVDSYGQLRCLSLQTGDRVWEDLSLVPKARWANIHLVRHGAQVWMFNERGELIITELSPQGCRQISRTRVIEPTLEQLDQRGGVCWSHPAFADRCIFARNDKELACADLAEGDRAREVRGEK